MEVELQVANPALEHADVQSKQQINPCLPSIDLKDFVGIIQ